MMHYPVRLRTTLVVLLGATAACAGTLVDPERFLVDAGGPDASGVEAKPPGDPQPVDGAAPGVDAGACPDVPTAVFQANCTSAGCHNAQDKAQGLDLQSSGLDARLVGVPTTEGHGVLIDPSSPANSVLYTKVTPMPPFGARMPLGSALDAPTIACVLEWVTQQTSGDQ